MYPIVSENSRYCVREEYFVMSDNIGLYTRTVIPKGKDKYPIIFIRDPYVPNHSGIPYDIEKCDTAGGFKIFLEHGYAVVYQHCRGTGVSEGICIPYSEKERNDGLETLELIRKLPIYNGEIYLYGGSYLASVHLLYLATNPKDIKTAALHIQTDRMYYIAHRNGCRRGTSHEWWLKRAIRKYPYQNYGDEMIRPYKDIARRVVGEDVPEYTPSLMNDEYNDYWKNDPRTNVMEELDIPVLLTEGWFDFYNYGMFSMWERLKPETKKKSLFAVGPWGHALSVTSDAEYDMPNGNLPEDFWVEWFDSKRFDRPFKYGELGKMKYYNVGSDSWKISEWPKSGSKKKIYFNSDNKLTLEPHTDNAEITYQYDPDEKQEFFKFANIYKAPEANTQSDVISFTSDKFTTDESFFGSVKFSMNVSSDCEDTAFFMRLYLVENGVAYNLTDDITSLSYIDSNYIPGDVIRVDMSTPPIAVTVKKGASLRVDIASSCKGYMLHANVKGHWAEVTTTKIANNTLFLKDSYIELQRED